MEIMTKTGIAYGAFAGMRTNAGAPSNGTSEVQTIAIGGTPTAGSFKIVNSGGRNSAAITWSATNATLLANLQTQLDLFFGAGNTVATAGTLTAGIGTILVTFAADLAALDVPPMTVINSLTGTSPTLSISTSTPGVTATHRGAPAGTLCQDVTNGNQYVNGGTATAPDWGLVTTS